MISEKTSPYHILYVDDEERALHYFQKCFEDDYVVHVASNAADGFRILEEYGARIGILLTDQRMPGESGVELMERARRLHPNLIRILVTAYTDYEGAVKAVNDGRAWRYLHKPMDPDQLAAILAEGMEAYVALLNRDRMLYEKADDIRTQLMADKVSGMGILAEGLNHHLRNALTVVRAFIDLAPMKLMEEVDARRPQDPSFWIETQGQAIQQLDRIQALLTNLAHASHARKLERGEEVSLAALFQETHAAYSSHLMEKRIQVEMDVAIGMPTLLVHGERFRQMLRLIFIEEITHLQPGDQILLRANMEVDGLGEPYAVITLTDNGCWGGASDRGANLFDPFYTRSRKPDDFGVNMMACFVTMHLHGGTVAAKRLEPQGLELKLRLPLDPHKNCQEAEVFLRGTLVGDARWNGPLSRAA